jgi:hypothetical protein
VKRLASMRAEMDPKDRDAMASDLEALKSSVTELLRAIWGK